MRYFVLLHIVLFALLSHAWSFECGTQSNITLVSDGAEHAARATSELEARLRNPWPLVPRGNRQWRVVRYCFKNKTSYTGLFCAVQEAVLRWESKMACAGFKGTSNLKFEETTDGNPDLALRKSVFCRIGGTQVWNPEVNADTLEIYHDKKTFGGLTTFGYDRNSNEEGRHWMKIGKHKMRRADRVDVITHELGHVLGMNHEFQRSDRDDYLSFHCENIVAYPYFLHKAQEKEPNRPVDELRNSLCTDFNFAAEIGFFSPNFYKYDTTHSEPGSFDIDSVMMYSSNASADSRCSEESPQFCPLLKYHVRDGVVDKNAPLEFYRARNMPSDGDAEFVRRWYPTET